MNADRLIDLIEDAGYTARSYSGRGMYGRCCVGIEVPSDVSVFSVAIELALICEDGEVRNLSDLSPREDSLGLDTILYFPHIEWPKGRADSDEEEMEEEEDDDN